MVASRADFNQISGDQLLTWHPAQQSEKLARGGTSHRRSTGAWRKCMLKNIDFHREIHRRITHPFAWSTHDFGRTEPIEIVDTGNREPESGVHDVFLLPLDGLASGIIDLL